MSELTQERLKEVVDYNSFTGLFTWLVTRGSRAAKGEIAGNLDPSGYIKIRIDGKLYYAHRLVWLYVKGRWPVEQVDHINGVRADNRLINLRECNVSQNAANSKAHLDSVVPFKGVYKNKQGAYVSRLYHKGSVYSLGCYLTPEEAKHAYDLKAKELQGEFFKNERTV